MGGSKPGIRTGNAIWSMDMRTHVGISHKHTHHASPVCSILTVVANHLCVSTFGYAVVNHLPELVGAQCDRCFLMLFNQFWNCHYQFLFHVKIEKRYILYIPSHLSIPNRI